MTYKLMHGFDVDGLTVDDARTHLTNEGYAALTFRVTDRGGKVVRIEHHDPRTTGAAYAAMSRYGNCAMLTPPDAFLPAPAAAPPYRGFDGVDTVDLLVLEGELDRAAPTLTMEATGVLSRIQEELARRPAPEMARAVKELSRQVRETMKQQAPAPDTGAGARFEAAQQVIANEVRRITEQYHSKEAPRFERDPDAQDQDNDEVTP